MGLMAAAALAQRLAGRSATRRQKSHGAATALAAPDGAIIATLGAALADDLPYMKRDGGFVRAGYDAALDETRALAR